MGRIGSVKIRTGTDTVELPVFDESDSTKASKSVRVETEAGTGFIPLESVESASFPFLRIETSEGVKAFTDKISSSFWSTDFEEASTNSLPQGWIQSTTNSSGFTDVRDSKSSSGSQALRTYEPSLGQGSDVEASTANYSPSGDHVITFYTLADYANNVNQYTSYSYSNTDDLNNSVMSWLLNFKSGDSNAVRAYDGNLDGSGSYTDVATISENNWMKIELEVLYSSKEYYVTIDDGGKQGPFGFRNDVSASDVPHFKVRSQNYTFWTDNITTETL